MANEQQGDVLLIQSLDDGEISVTGGLVVMDGGMRTAAYISLFGGNEDDSGSAQDAANWWGNIGVIRQIRSETQHLLQTIPPSSGNLRRIEDAVKRDLAWLISDNVASTVTASVTIPTHNSVNIAVTIDGDSVNFVDNWSATT